MVKPLPRSQAVPAVERRSGRDRRQRDSGPPDGWERRRSVEARKPEVTELEFTPSQWGVLQGDTLPMERGQPHSRPDIR
jgi:hypothetical protein